MINELLNKYRLQEPKKFGENHQERCYPVSAVIAMLEEQKQALSINGVVKSLPTEINEFLEYIKETCIVDCNDWHSLLHNKQFESNEDLYKQYLKDKK